jgi:hypothetical protein
VLVLTTDITTAFKMKTAILTTTLSVGRPLASSPWELPFVGALPLKHTQTLGQQQHLALVAEDGGGGSAAAGARAAAAGVEYDPEVVAFDFDGVFHANVQGHEGVNSPSGGMQGIAKHPEDYPPFAPMVKIARDNAERAGPKNPEYLFKNPENCTTSNFNDYRHCAVIPHQVNLHLKFRYKAVHRHSQRCRNRAKLVRVLGRRRRAFCC